MTTLEPIVPARAVVVPRGVPLDGGETLPLEAHVRRLVRRHQIVAVVGEPGSGKSVALAHLASVMIDADVDFYDAPVDLFAVTLTGRPSVIACDAPPAELNGLNASVALAPWGEAERIDYLLARHPTRIRAVMERLRSCDCVDALDGSPRLWTLVLDEMADRELPGSLVGPFLRGRMHAALGKLTDADDVRATMAYALATRGRATHATAVPALLRHRFFSTIAFVDEATRHVADASPLSAIWHKMIDPDLIRAVAARMRDRADLRDALDRRLAAGVSRADRPTEASIVGVLLAADPDYRPPATVASLDSVHAPRARWAGVRLQDASLQDARLARADLTGATLDRAHLRRADLTGANLSAAGLMAANLRGATLVEASLAGANLRDADLVDVQATAAVFDAADLSNVLLGGADLSGASFRRADLARAAIGQAQLAAADFTSARLDGLRCVGLDWRDAILDDARAVEGSFVDCRFDGMTVFDVNLIRARLARADLTATTFRRATLAGANLTEAGVADVDWEGCDLRHANFDRAAFHMGSSRSGLVDSAIAGEGSRTGFYTHDDGLPHFQPPEQIRKANLCGCDLRGAKVEGTHWYLVDLRGARYDADQAAWFRKCGAILSG